MGDDHINESDLPINTYQNEIISPLNMVINNMNAFVGNCQHVSANAGFNTELKLIILYTSLIYLFRTSTEKTTASLLTQDGTTTS